MPKENKNKVEKLKEYLETSRATIDAALQIIYEEVGETQTVTRKIAKKAEEAQIAEEGDSQIIEGVFDGQNMIGPNKKAYSVPANYASKSKLVQGDLLKLTILPDGRFVYKQIAPVERNTTKGILEQNEQKECFVKVGDKKYKVLKASITYFRGEPDDEVTITVPKNQDADWAAVEYITKKDEIAEEINTSEEETSEEDVDIDKDDALREDSLDDLEIE